ncbi:type I polyketide synthase [Aspergillus clavatus NRRL 1]|uniref:Polyketide synthase, putative n=1 Tax=Aspergillus clavatus (strain ATCC 1007 / CBS 513.65 / DSM 816 / NCTC 3887 / NRRL 1 / QM 1276 / 107) TaxID=344612 RepID=A1CD09_ASPCL|nr:polyketide synthase, putative [Aspergillus clavatus NRRL 1]EAW12416.1 polyketide synthase, putative [Aspergillus clavatus NRRL 1]
MEQQTMPLAIIGMACQFAGDVSSPEKLWQLCADGNSAWKAIPESRFAQKELYHPDNQKQGTTNVEGGHFLEEDVSLFDAAFFNFSSEVANTMDPQFRLQLETVYEALENAGIPLDQIAGYRTSVYAGAFFRDYHDSLMRDPATLTRFFMTGNGSAMASNRISHFYDLRGPSMTVDTGCSTTLTTLHLACQSLRNGESDVSIVAGSNILLNPDMFESMSSLGFLSPSGKSYAFDHRASGYGRGEGVATLIVKPLTSALRDGDPIRAVIRETALNQDGWTPTITSPSQKAQEELIRLFYQRAGLDPLETSYVEAHGTGTPAGDPVEAAALSAALNTNRSSQEPLLIGSVKSNIGHTETASGLASIIKVTMALEKGYIPPSANFEKPNKDIDMNGLNIEIPTLLRPWPQALRRASVNNFGYGGANSHVIIESPAVLTQPSPAIVSESGSLQSRVFVLSAKEGAAVSRMASRMAEHLRGLTLDDESAYMRHLAFSLGQRRSNFPWKAAYLASTKKELIEKLEQGQVTPQQATEQPRLGFVFTGQGAQWYAMGRELIEAYPVFKDALLEADQCLKSFGAKFSIIEELSRDEASSKVNTAMLSLPLCTAVQIALVKLLRSWNISPIGVTGHSSGEVAAAFTAGAIDVRSAMAIVYMRGALTSSFQEKIGSGRGGMVAVGLGKEAAEAYVAKLTTGKVVVACINSPESVTVSGDITAIEELESQLVGDGIFARKLKVEAAYHSHHMQPFADEYSAALQQILRDGKLDDDIIYSSPVSGTRTNGDEVSRAEHWVQNMLQPVLFLDSLTNLCLSSDLNQQVDTILEVGPHSALAGPVRQTMGLPAFEGKRISYLSCLSRGENAVETMQSLAATLRSQGTRVDLSAVNFPINQEGLRVLHDLPSYPWNHAHGYWAEPRLNKEHRLRRQKHHDLLGSPLIGGNALSPTWRHIIRLSDTPWLRAHKVQSNIIYPGTGYICMAIEAVHQLSQGQSHAMSSVSLKDVEILKILIVPETEAGVEVHLTLHESSDKVLTGQLWQEFHIYSCDNSGKWSEHCKGLIARNQGNEAYQRNASSDDNVYLRQLKPQELYRTLQAKGIYHGKAFQNLVSIQYNPGRSLCTLRVADTASSMPYGVEKPHVLHPTTLDSIFQAVYSSLPTSALKANTAMVPRAFKRMDVRTSMSSTPGHVFQAQSMLHRANPQGMESSVVVSDTTSKDPVLTVDGLYYQSLGIVPEADGEKNDKQHHYTLQWAPDISFPTPRTLKAALQFAADFDEIGIIRDIREACFYFIRRALANLAEDRVMKLNWHQQRLWAWMKVQIKLAQLNELGPISSEWAGMGGCTELVLDALREQDALGSRYRCASYDFTDISSGFFEAASERFKEVGDVMEFKKLNIEEDPSEQGFESNSYDLVIASQVLHATKNINRTLANVRKLLRPGGKLLLVEITRDEIDLQLIFGTLPGWWLGEEAERQSSPSLTIPEWQAAMKSTGFDGIDMELHDCEDEDFYAFSVLMASAAIPDPAIYPQFTIVYKEMPPPKWLHKLITSLEKLTTFKPDVQQLGAFDAEGKTCLFLGEMHEALLDEPGSAEFGFIQSLLIQAAGVLWVSRGSTIHCERPHNTLHTGLLRALRLEHSSKRLVSLDIDPTTARWPVSAIATILDIARRRFLLAQNPSHLDNEYAERGGIMCVPRVFETVDESSKTARGIESPGTKTELFHQSSQKLRLQVSTPGLLDTLGFVAEPMQINPIPEESIEVEPKAFGLNFRDVMVAMGQLSMDIMGFECSGVVTQVGSLASQHGFKIGDRVCALMRGHWENRVCLHWTSVVAIPDGMTFEVAASIPMAFTTSYYALYETARLQPGESVLIHAAAGGVGQAAIILAQRVGAEVFVTAGSPEKREYLSRQFGIPEDHIFSSRDAEFASQLMEITAGKGVDVVLNSLAGELLQRTFNCVAPFGRFVEIGKRDLEQNKQLEMHAFTRHISFSSVDLIALGELKGAVVSRIMNDIMRLIKDEGLRLIQPITTYPISRIHEAFRILQAGRHIGKVIVIPGPDDRVNLLPSGWPLHLDSESTHLVIGGMGGVGRSICEWLVQRGARNLIIMSRNAEQQAQGSAYVNALRASGCTVVVASCDISDKFELKQTLDGCLQSMPPLRGVIHSGMVLQDTVYENMSLEDYARAVRPKVQGTWNLHQVLSDVDLVYFIMLSSLSGITGNVSQANYSAGNTFQDAIARHRSARGLPAVAIDLGMVREVGYVAETDGVANRLERMGFRAVDEEEVLHLIQEAILRPLRHATDSQILTGFNSHLSTGDTNAFWAKDPILGGVLRATGTKSTTRSNRVHDAMDLREQLTNVPIPNDRLVVLETAIVRKLAAMFFVEEAAIQVGESLARYGVDSLVAVELRNWLVVQLGIEVSIFDIMQGASVKQLASSLVAKWAAAAA